MGKTPKVLYWVFDKHRILFLIPFHFKWFSKVFTSIFFLTENIRRLYFIPVRILFPLRWSKVGQNCSHQATNIFLLASFIHAEKNVWISNAIFFCKKSVECIRIEVDVDIHLLWLLLNDIFLGNVSNGYLMNLYCKMIQIFHIIFSAT